MAIRIIDLLCFILGPFQWLFDHPFQRENRRTLPMPISVPPVVHTKVESPVKKTKRPLPPSTPTITICTSGLDLPDQDTAGESPGGLSPAQSLPSRRNSRSLCSSTEISPTESFARSRSSSASSMGSVSNLKADLRGARVECSYDRREKFIPLDNLRFLIDKHNVAKILREQGFEEPIAKDIAVQICSSNKRLFAILVMLKKPQEIRSFLEEHISDDDLPLWRPIKDKEYLLQKKNDEIEEPVQSIKNWTLEQREKFDTYQRLLTAPYFKYLEHNNFEDRVLPFIVDDKTPEVKEGAYSKVFARRIHPAHHNLPLKVDKNGNYPLVAIKTLKSLDKDEFEKEYEALKRIHHPHLIKLLATFQHKGEWNFIFQYADSNLRAYWEEHPRPKFKDIIRWSLKQMVGIACGLAHIHNFRPTFPQSGLIVQQGSNAQATTTIQVRDCEKTFGRHGDIKPENILFFRQMDDVDDAQGILQVADFGLGRFHGRDSRSGIPPTGIQTSPTYEPPEVKISKPVSRAYDIWSLGCLYLEFITWLLHGNEQIEKFAEDRGEISTLGINDDNFFTVLPNGDHAIVREGVKKWVQGLHSHPACSQLIHDLLDLIMEHMIRVDADKRIKSIELNNKLIGIRQKAEDETYLLAPVPRSLQLPGAPTQPTVWPRRLGLGRVSVDTVLRHPATM